MARWWRRDGRADARKGLVRITTWTSRDMAAKCQNGGQHMSQLARSDRALAWSRTEGDGERQLHSLFLGETKHPAMLGATGREAWGEIWARSSRCMTRCCWKSDLGRHFQMFFTRRLPRERSMSFGFQPILAEDGVSVEGIFAPAPRRPRRLLANGGSRHYATRRPFDRTAVRRGRLPGCGRGSERQPARYSICGNLPARRRGNERARVAGS